MNTKREREIVPNKSQQKREGQETERRTDGAAK